jgi:putative tryptophan/tyrosine transport system substrate-binding protein
VIDRRTVLFGAAGLLGSGRVVHAQPGGKVYRLGLLSPAGAPPASTYDSRSDIVEVLREVGYVEGRNLTVERRYADGRVDRLGTLAADLVQRPVDLIVAFSPVAGQAARDRTKTIPIVILFAGSDPVELGLVSNLARPGGNVTGVVLGSVLADKRLELLKEVVPSAKRIAMLVAGAPLLGSQVGDAEHAAARLDIKLMVVDAKDRDYERAFEAIKRQGADALYVAPSPVLSSDRGRIIDLAARHRLPTIYQWLEHVDDGGLMAYGASLRWVAQRVAGYVDRIFKGAKPSDLPIEQATVLGLALNLKTAKALGLTFPPSVLTRADKIVE